MMRVVLDANQYASALIKPRSNSARIMDLVHEASVALVISDAILEELRRVLAYPKLVKLHRRSPAQIDAFLRDLEKVASVAPGLLTVRAVKDDPSDDKYLACAIEGDADFIVSGDHHLKDLGEFEGIPIVDPAFFLAIVEREE